MRVGIVVPHVFMHEDILPQVIFSPGKLALDLSEGLQRLGADVTLFTPGPIAASVRNITADLSYFEQELSLRDDTYLDLLKKHPFTFITLARQVQSELIARAFAMANQDELDVVHIYTNEEDIALPFAKLCQKPVMFTHHDPFNFLVKYKNVFPKYPSLNWLSISLAQRTGMPPDTNWIGNIYHGVDGNIFKPVANPQSDYIAYIGRIIESKGTHLAIAAVQTFNEGNPDRPYKLKLAGKHYAGKKDRYWQERIAPQIDSETVEYVGFIGDDADKQAFLANAAAIIVPSTFNEPFGMVMIEALACGTPIIGLDSGAIPEIIKSGENGIVVKKKFESVPPADASSYAKSALDKTRTITSLAEAINGIAKIKRIDCRQNFETRFTLQRMCQEHLVVYQSLLDAWSV